MASGSSERGVEDEGFPSFLFNFDQYEKIDRAGIFADLDGRLELIEGRVVQMAPARAELANVTIDLAVTLTIALNASSVSGLKVLSQSTLKIGDHSAPEPDVFVAKAVLREGYYEAQDAKLVVEVAVTTLRPDQSVKRPMYARAGVPELWIVEPARRSIHVHRQPQANGSWSEEFTVTEGGVSPLFAPEIEISLSKLFGR